MSYGVAESVLVRADAYRAGYRQMALIAAVSAGVAAIAVIAALYAVLTRPEPRYFATTPTGQIQPLVPLDQPHLSAEAATNFAVQAVTTSLTYDFANYRDDFQRAQAYFTKPLGWNSFVEAVQNSGTLDLVRARKFNTTAVAQNAVIVQEGVRAGRYEWVIQIPVRVTYQSASALSGQSLVVSVRLQRLETYKTPYGVAIAQFIAAPHS